MKIKPLNQFRELIATALKSQTRKSFFCTHLSMSAKDIFDLYRTMFQIEFVFRGADFLSSPGTKASKTVPGKSFPCLSWEQKQA